jgi:hypothetical protein
MKPSPEQRATALAEKLQEAVKQDSAYALGRAIIDAIDQSLAERGRPGKRDRTDAEDRD